MKALRSILVLALLSLPLRGAMAASDVADAVMQHNAAQLQTLLKSHADVNAAQADGSTALHWAAYQGDARAAATLLAAGAHPGAVTDTGMTPLLLACESGNVELVEELVRAGASVNQTLDSGETPLMMAARTGSVPVIRLLLAHGAILEAREKKRGTTALMWAAANANPEAVRFLLSKGADRGARSASTDPGRKPYLARLRPGRSGSQTGHGFGRGTPAGNTAACDGEGGARLAPPAEAAGAEQEPLGCPDAAHVRNTTGRSCDSQSPGRRRR